MKRFLEILNEKAKEAGVRLRLLSYEPEMFELAAKEYESQFRQAAVSGNEVAVAFAEWIGQKTQKDSWFKFDWQGWYIHLKGHMTSAELFKEFEKAKATDR